MSIPSWTLINSISLKQPCFNNCPFDDSVLFLCDEAIHQMKADGSIETFSCLNCPPPRRFAACCQSNSSVFMFGGLDNSNSALRDLWCINLNGNTSSPAWKKMQAAGSVPPPLFGSTIVSYQNYLVVFGGCRADGTASDSLFIYDTLSSMWLRCNLPIQARNRQKWPTPRALSSSFIHDGHMYILFGCTRVPTNLPVTSDASSIRSLWGRFLDDSWKLRLSSVHPPNSFEPPTARWEKITMTGASPPSRAACCVSVSPYEDKILISGGFSSYPRSPCTDSFLLNLSSMVCKPLRCRGSQRPPARAFGCITTTSIGFLIASGVSCNSFCNDAYALDFTAMSNPGTPRTPTRTPRECYTPRTDPSTGRSYFYAGLPSLNDVIPTIQSPFSARSVEEPSTAVSTGSYLGFSEVVDDEVEEVEWKGEEKPKKRRNLKYVDGDSILLLKSLSSVAENYSDLSSRGDLAISHIKSAIDILVEEITRSQHDSESGDCDF
ncbi:hypothetical protein GEMRC1_006719 [Eukaryota sp. GEM-RC1]